MWETDHNPEEDLWLTVTEEIDHRSKTHIPMATVEQLETLSQTHHEISLNRKVRQKGYPNRWGAKIPIKPNWNLKLLEQLLEGYPDRDIVEWMKYGWPIGRLPTMEDPTVTFKNHKGATEHPEALEEYIQKERTYGAVMGPFQVIPFEDNLGISPLSTRPKKDSEERRVIVDLSFPPGQSVNDGIMKDNYLGFSTQLTFPKTDDFALRIYTLGTGALMFKIDLKRYFRQLDLDPGDYSLVGYVINHQLYFDKMVPMGVRTGPYIAQRVSSAITWIVKQLEYFLLNYVDDFVGAERGNRAWKAYDFLTKLLRDLWVQTSPEKRVPPTTRLDFLGTTFDSEKMTMEVPPQKLQEIKEILDQWLAKDSATRQEMESLIGKLQFAARCVRAGRVFLARIINWLKGTDRKNKYQIPPQAHRDIVWWHTFIQTYNGISLIWLHTCPGTDRVMATDSNLEGYGGISGQEYFRGKFPAELKGKNIAILELWAVLIGLRLWSKKFKGYYFWIHVDNEAVATILNTGASKQEEMQSLLREIAYIAAQNQFVIKAKHIMGVTNRIPDWLSRWKEPQARRNFRAYAKEKSLKQLKVLDKHLQLKSTMVTLSFLFAALVELAELDEMVAKTKSLAVKESTKKGYLTHLTAYIEFCDRFDFSYFPCDNLQLCRFGQFLVKYRGLKSAESVGNYISGIRTGMALIGMNIPDPLEKQMQLFNQGLKTLMPHETKQMKPITPEILLKIYDVVDFTNLTDMVALGGHPSRIHPFPEKK